MARSGKQFVVSSVAQCLLLLVWLVVRCLSILSTFFSDQLENIVISLGERIDGSRSFIADEHGTRSVKAEARAPTSPGETCESLGQCSTLPPNALELPRPEQASIGGAEWQNRPSSSTTHRHSPVGLPSVPSTPNITLSMYRMRCKFYAISSGFHDGIFTFWWGGGHPQTNRAKPSVHKGFNSLDHAEMWLRSECNNRGHIHHWEVVGRNQNGHSIFVCIGCGETFVRDRPCCKECDSV